MSENPTNDPASRFPRSAAITANDSHESCVPRMSGVETAHHEWIFDRNKRFNIQEPLIMSGFPARPPKVGFVSHPTRILEHFLMFSMRWALFGIFSSASIRVHPRPNDFSQDPREWLCLEKCRPTRCLEAPPTGPEFGITVNYSKESE
jgi:hypothetical protein